ncbi:MAG: hypothetical protein QM633_13960, partial [Propionicimonas sp.]
MAAGRVRCGVAAAVLCLSLPGWTATLALAASPEPTPTETPGPLDPTPDPDAPQTSSPEQTAEGEPTVPPQQGSGSPTASPTTPPVSTPTGDAPSATAPAGAPTTPPRSADAIPAAWREAAAVDPTSWITALVVLLAAFVLVGALSRRRDPPVQPLPEPPPGPAVTGPTGGVEAGLGVLEAVGEAMIDAGYSVTGIRSALVDIATVNGYPATEIVVLPTALFVSTRGHGEVHTGAVSSGHGPLRLNQIDALDEVVRAARRAPSAPGAVTAGIATVRGL